MNDPGKFVISFDCEGKWGMADHLTPDLEQLLTDAQIEAAYDRLLAILARHDVRATFAFVGIFTLSPDEYRDVSDWLWDARVGDKNWLDAFRRDAASGRFEGWLVPEALRKVQRDGRHEIGTHGFTHVPLDEETCTPELFFHELESARQLAQRQGWVPRTLVYPRNQIGHTSRLTEHHILGYREMLWPGLYGSRRKLRGLAREFGYDARSQPVAPATSPTAIPSGHILNFWHNRSRRLVPRGVTRRRWRRMMLDAAATGGCVHLWSHPHNFITDPDLIGIFNLILHDAAELIKQGRLRSCTQEELCCDVVAPRRTNDFRGSDA
jgi:peptidoglycan/xylan/chitin deacetylase (PgdA/CDA1 family)